VKPGGTEPPPHSRFCVGEAAGLTASDLEAQIQWLTQRAAERGFASPDEMAAKDIGGFVKLAEEWRKAYPAGKADPIAAAADKILAQAPDRLMSVGQNPDGTPITRTLREYLAAERGEAANAREDAKLFELASECLILQGG